MEPKCLQGKERCPSLAGKLGRFVSLSVAITTLATLVAFCIVTYRIQIQERRNNLQSVAATVGKLIERPISLGDYALVEAYLSGQNLPIFIEAFAVKGADGSLFAGQDFSEAQGGKQCSVTETVTIPIGKTSAVLASAPVLTMRAGFCDIRSNAIGLGIGAVSLAAFLVLVISIISRLAVNRALRPLTRSVNLVASQADLSTEVLEKAPEEIKPLLARLNQLYGEYLEVEASAKVGELAEQIAHDIRSPLTSLRSMANQSANLPPDQKRTLLSVIDRITDIANGLLKTKRNNTLSGEPVQAGSAGDSYLVNDVIESLISEKRAQYRPRTEVKIESVLAEETSAVFADMNRGEFQSVLSNLIDNAFEAICGSGAITVRLGEPSASRFSVEIHDSGVGIPEEHQSRLGEKGFTFGKNGGSGLGLYGAKRFAEGAGGGLEIVSTAGNGTQVALLLPLAVPPSWYLPKVTPTQVTTVIVVDNDDSIYAVWQDRLNRAGIPPKQVLHVRCRAELESEVLARDSEEHLMFLLDFDLGDRSDDGLTLAAAIPCDGSKILVTSHYDNGEVRARAQALGIKILPKHLVPYVPIEVIGGTLDCVLIDDDVTVQTVWQSSARTFGKRIRIFSDPPNDDDLKTVPCDTLFYIDQKLRNGVRGTEVSKCLFERGFKNLVLASGFDGLRREEIPWVKKVTFEKEPPWESTLDFSAEMECRNNA